MSVLYSNILRIKVKIEYKSNQFYWYRTSPVTCMQLHKNNQRLNISTNIVIDETKVYEKYGN